MDIYKLIDIEFINRIEKFYPAFIDLVIKYRKEQGKEKIIKKDFLRKDIFLFEPESQIIRYLRDMIRQNKERFLEESGKDCVLINYLKPNERISLFSEANRDYLFFHLIRNNIISGIHFPGKTGTIKDLESGEKISYRPKTAFKIINIRKVKELLESLENPTKKKREIKKKKLNPLKAEELIRTLNLEPNTHELDFCKVMFKRKPGMQSDWSKIYEEMTGDKEACFERPEKTKRLMYDVVNRFNKKIKKKFKIKEDLIIWRNNTIMRRTG